MWYRLRWGVTLASQLPRGSCPLKNGLHFSVPFSPSVEQNCDLDPRPPHARRALQPPPPESGSVCSPMQTWAPFRLQNKSRPPLTSPALSSSRKPGQTWFIPRTPLGPPAYDQRLGVEFCLLREMLDHEAAALQRFRMSSIFTLLCLA